MKMGQDVEICTEEVNTMKAHLAKVQKQTMDTLAQNKSETLQDFQNHQKIISFNDKRLNEFVAKHKSLDGEAQRLCDRMNKNDDLINKLFD